MQDLCPGGSLAPYVGKLTDKQMFLVIAEIVSIPPRDTYIFPLLTHHIQANRSLFTP